MASAGHGPAEGFVWAEAAVDRSGNVRELGPIVSDNPGVKEVARQAMLKMHFAPIIRSGVPVQAVSVIVLPFKTTRPAGRENFETAKTYFERARAAGFLASGGVSPYVLRAEFEAKIANGAVATGNYEDTCLGQDRWRREARIAASRFERSQAGEKRYLLEEGPDGNLLKLVLKILEPIPAVDTLTESDWRMKRDTVDGVNSIRVLTGYETPEGEFDPKVRGFWFDERMNLRKAYFTGLEIRRSEFEEYSGKMIARRIDVYRGGKLALKIRVTEVAPTSGASTSFEIKGHEWTRAFTDEVR